MQSITERNAAVLVMFRSQVIRAAALLKQVVRLEWLLYPFSRAVLALERSDCVP
jgi:hypothetical protein